MPIPSFDTLKETFFIALALYAGYVIIRNMIREWKRINSHNINNPVIVFNSYFNIKHAILCVDCETVFSRKAYQQCPRCGSKSLFTINYTFETEPIWNHTKPKKKEGVILQ